MIEVKIPFRTPSVNNLYGKTFRHNSVYLKQEGKELKKEIAAIINFSIESWDIPFTNKLSVTTEVHENWLTKKGTVKKKDLANREKFLIDAIFESLGLEDSYIFEHTMRKIQSEKEFAIIKIEVLE